ncbi:MAG: site-specific integrase [Eubacterium sp.]
MAEEKKQRTQKSKSRGNGDGTIYFIESKGLWAAQYTVGRDINGKLKRKTVYGKTRKAVKEKLNAIITQLGTNSYVDKSSITIEQLISNLIEEDYELNIINDNSYLRKIATLNRIKSHMIGALPVQKATESEIKSFLKGVTNYSDSVISKDYALLNRCFKVAVQKDIIVKNPMNGVRKPKSEKPPKKVRALTVDEQRQLISILNNEEINHPYRYQLLLMLYTGMRMGEINALTPKDVNLDFKTIHVQRTLTRDKNEHTIVGKTTKTYAGQRLISMTDTVYNLLKDYMENKYIENKDGLLFYDHRAKKILTTNQCNMYLARLKTRYGFIDENVSGNVNLHSLRHTFATRCIESNMPVKVLQHLLGHTDIKTTLDTYCDVFEKFEQEHIHNAEAYLSKIMA